MLGFTMLGASSGPPDSMTSTWAPDADNSAARTEPAAPAPTTMKSNCSLDMLVILNSQSLKSDFESSLEGEGIWFASRPDEARSSYPRRAHTRTHRVLNIFRRAKNASRPGTGQETLYRSGRIESAGLHDSQTANRNRHLNIFRAYRSA